MATLKSIKNKYLTTSDGDVLGVTTNTENVAALSFKLATADSLSKFNLVDGFSDDYNDATGVDAAGSTNDVRNAAGNYYTGTTSTWETGDRSSTITVTSTANTFRDPTSAQAGTAGTNQQFVNGSTTGNNTTDSMRQGINLTVAGRYIAFDLGSAKIVVDAKWYQSTGNGNGTWKWQADSASNFSSAVDVGSSFNLQATTGSNPYTQSWTSDLGSNVTAYRYWRLLGVSGNLTAATDQWIHELEFKVDVAGADMTLQSNAFTAQADPATARIIIDEESINGDTTLNTDLKAYASRDNGTTFTQITNLARQSFMAGSGIDNNTKLMLHCNGANNGTTFTDSTFSPKTVTVVGDTHTDTAIKKFGTASAQFDGTGDYLTCATSDDWNFGSEPFTIDLWVYHTGTPTDHMGIICHRTGGSGWELKINAPATNKWTFYDSNGAAEIVSNSTVTNDAWVHLAVTRNSAGLINLWVDGTKQTSERTTATFTDYNNILRIGDENQAGADNKWLGYMDEIRIVKGVCLYTSNFTPASQAYSSRRLLSGSVDISGQPAGTNMKYKVTTHNQAVAKQTRVYGTSMAWA